MGRWYVYITNSVNNNFGALFFSKFNCSDWETTINYSIAKHKEVNTQNVKVNIYDTVGKLVKTLINTKQAAGYYSVIFEADNLSSGIYYYQLLLENFTTSRKMILLK